MNWIKENPDMTTDAAIAKLRTIFKDISVKLLPLIKKLDQSKGVRKTLGVIHFNKLRSAAEDGEFDEHDCQKFAYQISPGLASTFFKEIGHAVMGLIQWTLC